MKKIFFVLKKASIFTRILALISLVLAVVSIVTMCVGVNAALKGPITDLPLVEMLEEAMGLDDLGEETEAISDEIQAALDSADPEEIEAIEEEYGMKIEELEKSFEEISLSSISLAIQGSGDEEAAAIMSGLVKGIGIYAGVVIALMALAAVFMKKGLMVLSFLLSLPFCFLFVGMAAVSVIAVATIGYMVLMSMVNRSYKQYKRAN